MRSYSTTAFVKQFNFKNATAFFTNAFKRKAALNKGSLFYISALVNDGSWCRTSDKDYCCIGADYQAQHDRKNTQKDGLLEDALLAQNKILQIGQLTAQMAKLPQ